MNKVLQYFGIMFLASIGVFTFFLSSAFQNFPVESVTTIVERPIGDSLAFSLLSVRPTNELLGVEKDLQETDLHGLDADLDLAAQIFDASKN